MRRSRRVGLAFLFQSLQAVAEAPLPDLARCAAVSSAVECFDCYEALARRLATEEAGYQAVVSEVQDGDSVIVLRNGSHETIRLAEVDAPELPQPYGSEARAYVTGLLMGQTRPQ